MVQRLNAQQTKQVIRDLVPQGLCDYQVPDPVSAEALEASCGGIAALPGGRSYGWFDSKFVPRGILVGLIRPDPFTGTKQGFEHLWWTSPKYRGKPALELMAAFEADCCDEKCARMVFGFSAHAAPKMLSRLYEKLGFGLYLTSVAKDL